MFRRRKESAARVTVLGEGSALEGKITVRGALELHGALVGQLSCDGHVAVGSQGRVLGQVCATQLTVGGNVDGIVYTRDHLCVLSTGRIRGHARYASLEVARGGIVHASTSLTVDYPDSELDSSELKEAAE